ncbi:hypothetical protein AB432_018445 [Brevibacillus brevis]|uniref:DUF3888 domain-containing protein n=1 Tax=Brevibacillus brevis TaxID=1393 RepID=A0A2Z4MKB2_BREBE|nr:hypothetical protein [Brevibacillus brevis]AWX56904.1 hypothetical protein AB432_018445 [Brevibacillus brevis]
MRKLIILLGFSLFSFITPSTYAADLHPKPPIRDIINSIDHWIRKGWTLEQHIRHECEAHESWKIPRGHKRLKNFKIVSVTPFGSGYQVYATYEVTGTKCRVHAKVSRCDGIWENQGFTFDYHK